jgi:hypothetical protein
MAATSEKQRELPVRPPDTLELKMIKLVVGSFIRLQKRMTGHCLGTRSLPGRRRKGDMPVGYLG